MVTIFLALTLAGVLAIAFVVCATVYHWSQTDQHRDNAHLTTYTKEHNHEQPRHRAG